MRKVMSAAWMLSLASMLGIVPVTQAGENQQAAQADLIFNAGEPSLIQQVTHENCAIDACDPVTGDACYATTGCSKYWFGPDEAWDLGDTLFEPDSGWDIGGHVQFGYHNKSDGMFNNVPGKFHNHQSWLFVEKVADGSNGLGFGGRIDVMYGVDGTDTQAFGNDPGVFDYQNGWDHGIYSFAMPQLYAEFAYGNWSLKAGHFYTMLGYEVVPATGNFFYSHAMTMYNSEAFTHTGALSTYSANDNVTFYGGWTLGWDTGFDQRYGGSSFLGGVSIAATDDLIFTYIITAGDLGNIGEGYTHSLVTDWNITDRWEYVIQSDLTALKSNGGGNYDTIGVDQYLFYTINDRYKVGGRAEWWKQNGTSYNAVTGGVNITPMANLVVRPEVRYQWSPSENASALPVNQGAIFGIDAVLKF
ncbi:outer membrane beta-barrel protein [Planctomicrobium sp. SH527]|uniref:outer membrane beta-barrel protein n=1 Tax=Planctomicrobium sp. SH527 TaxID=3448123 RepID=UPI003F5C090A